MTSLLDKRVNFDMGKSNPTGPGRISGFVRAVACTAGGDWRLLVEVQVDRVLCTAGTDRSSSVFLWPSLTWRESEVATLLACGLDRPAIVSRLGFSEKTFDTHRLSLLPKLGLANAAQLARYAIREGLVSSAQEDDAP